MKKTKIICTLGPATDKKDLLVKMIRAGMDLAVSTFPMAPTVNAKPA